MNPRIVLLGLLSGDNCDLDNYRSNDGSLAICLPKGTDMSIVRKDDELTELERITSDFTTSIEILADNRTKTIFRNVQMQRVGTYNTYRACLELEGIVVVDGFLYIDASKERLYDSQTFYSVQVIGTHQQWKQALKELTLCKIDLGQFTHSISNIVSTWQANYPYQDGGVPFYPMLACYGEFFYEHVFNFVPPLETLGANLYDIRIAVYYKPLIEAAFCAAGYKIKSRFFNSTYFRRAAGYLLKPNFWENDNYGQYTKASVELSTDFDKSAFIGTLDAPIPFDIVNYDLGGHYLAAPVPIGKGWWYENNTPRNLDNINFRLHIEVCNINAFATNFAIFAAVYDNLNAAYFEFAIPPFDLLTGALIPIAANSCVVLDSDFNFDVFGITPTFPAGWKVSFNINSLSTGIIVKAGATMEAYPTGRHHYQDDETKVGQCLLCDVTAWDVLLDIKRLFNLRFKTTQSLFEVEIEPEPSSYFNFPDFAVPVQKVKGFKFDTNDLNGIIDITPFINNNQQIQKAFDTKQNQFSYNFAFADSSDEYQLYKSFDNATNPLWGNFYGLPATQGAQVVETKLSTIEPTINDNINLFGVGAAYENAYGIYIPFMFDTTLNEDGSLPTPQGINIRPRIFLVYGWLKQQFATGTGNSPKLWRFESVIFDRVPTIAQDINVLVENPSTLVTEYPNFNIVFGDSIAPIIDKNLLNTLYLQTILDKQIAATVQIDVKLSVMEWFNLGTRSVLRIDSSTNLGLQNGLYRILQITKNINSKIVNLVLVYINPCYV